MSDQQQLISPDGRWSWDGSDWRPRDPAAQDLSDDEDPAPANTYGLDDNCYYVTAAVLANTTVETLITATETMQQRGGASEAEITELFNAANLVSAHESFNDLEAVIDHLHETSGGFDRTFGLAFVRGDGSGHMVVANWDGNEQAFSYTDYQADAAGADATADVEAGQLFHLYGPQ